MVRLYPSLKVAMNAIGQGGGELIPLLPQTVPNPATLCHLANCPLVAGKGSGAVLK